jgi:hypothetical protein
MNVEVDKRGHGIKRLNELVGAVISVLDQRMRFLVLHACYGLRTISTSK